MLCKKCGNNVKSDFKYCPYCGERIVSDFHDHYEELTPPFLGPGTGRAGRCGGLVRRSAGGAGARLQALPPTAGAGRSLPSAPGPFRRRTWRTTSRRPISGFPCRRSRPPAGTAAPSSARTAPRQAGGTPRPRASSRWTTRRAVGGALFRLPSGAGRAFPRNRPRRGNALRAPRAGDSPQGRRQAEGGPGHRGQAADHRGGADRRGSGVLVRIPPAGRRTRALPEYRLFSDVCAGLRSVNI